MGWPSITSSPAELLAPVREEAHEVKIHDTVQREDVQTHAKSVRGKQAASFASSQHEIPAKGLFALTRAICDEEVDALVSARLAIVLAKHPP